MKRKPKPKIAKMITSQFKVHQAHCGCDTLGLYPAESYTMKEVRALHPEGVCTDCQEQVEVTTVVAYTDADEKSTNLTEIGF